MFGSSGADMSQASVTSNVTRTEYLDNVGIILSWTGTSPVGTLAIQASTDNTTWVALDFGSTISISGNTGTHILNINQVPFSYLRAVYTKTSGTGTLTALLSSKQVGG
jgi:hypothetical protein